MKRFVKIVLVVLGLLVALLVAAVIALPFLIDPNDYRDEINAAVEEKTGREFVMAGDLQLSVFPWLGVEMGPARLANAPGFGDRPFAEINAAQVSVRVLPLLRQRIEVGTVGLDGLRLRLAKKADGTTNWDDLVAALSGGQAPPESAPEREGSRSTMLDLEIGAIEVTDAAVSYHDIAAGRAYALYDANLNTGRLAMGEAFPVNLGFAFDAEEAGLTGNANLVAQLQPDLENQFYRLSEVVLNVRAGGEAVPGGEQQVRVTGWGEVDMQAGRMEVGNLVVQGFGTSVTGNVNGSDLTGRPTFSGHLAAEQANPRSVMRSLGIEPPVTSDPNALTTAAFDTRFQTDLNSIQLKQLLIRLDNSTLKGSARVDDIASPASEPIIGFNLALDRMNVDRYMPPEEDKPAENDGESESSTAGAAQIPLEPLKDLRLDGRVTAGSLTAANLKIRDAELEVAARDGVLTIRPLSANLYNGALRIDSTVDAAGRQPSYAVRGNLESLQLGPLLKDLIGQEKVSALANLRIDLTASGNTVEEIKRELNGTVAFEFRDGAFHGFDLARILTMARNRLLGQSTGGDAKADAAGETPFSRFAASFSVADGLFRGGDLDLVTPVARLAGAGTFNLATNQLDYTVKANIPENAEGDVLEELAGYTIPIRLSGDLFSPQYSVDLKSALEGAARQRLREEEAELREEIDERVEEERQDLREKFQRGLRDLLNGR